ncbi:MAG: nuclear transport factor 2 family protein [Hyphomonadaceae bacterium]|nr:nuclear transport factor 2 family protein [Hyphomonadaceae bacterium]
MNSLRAIVISLVLLPAVGACQTQAVGATAHSQTASPRAEIETLMDRWDIQVWREGRYDLVPDCLNERYVRHEQTGVRAGDRIVTREEYTAEIRQLRTLPNLTFEVHERSIVGDRVWTRFTMTWTDGQTGEPRSRTGLQEYRIENGKLAETWVLLSPNESHWPEMTTD